MYFQGSSRSKSSSRGWSMEDGVFVKQHSWITTGEHRKFCSWMWNSRGGVTDRADCSLISNVCCQRLYFSSPSDNTSLLSSLSSFDLSSPDLTMLRTITLSKPLAAAITKVSVCHSDLLHVLGTSLICSRSHHWSSLQGTLTEISFVLHILRPL